MSCNGCRVLRKGCSDNCVLRTCLLEIEPPEAQAHATLFVAKFFGRAGLITFISAVPESQRPALFRSLLFEACGRTINPIDGAVGLLWRGRWELCREAVDTVMRGGTIRPLPDLDGGGVGVDLGLTAEGRRRVASPEEEGSVTTSSTESGVDRSRRTAAAAAAPMLMNLFV